MTTPFDFTEELGLLRRAVAEPVPQLIVVEFDTLARLDQALEELIALNPARAQVILSFDFEQDTAAGLVQRARDRLKGVAQTPPPLLVLKGPAKIEPAEDAPVSQEFWKGMNQAREAWDALGAQILLCVERWSYRQVILHADHLLSWAGMKIHLIGSAERPASSDRTALAAGLFGDYRLSPALARERWRELEQGLNQAKERGENGEGFLPRFYIPMLEAALASGDLVLARQTREAARENGKFPDEDMPRWHELNLDLALAGSEPDLANEHAYKLLDLAENHPNERVRERAFLAVNNQARLLTENARFGLAEPLYHQALKIATETYGQEHPQVAACLNNLSLLYQSTNRLPEAESLMRRALAVNEKRYGPDHPEFAIILSNLAQIVQAMNRLLEAEPMLFRALAINENAYGQDSPKVANDLINLAQILHDTNRIAEAEPLMRRALAIHEKNYGPEHPVVAVGLNNLAALLSDTNRLKEAEPLMQRALAITEKCYGPDHPSVATCRNNLALLFQTKNRFDEAESLMRQALTIDLKNFKPEHPKIAIRLNNLAKLFEATNRLAEAEPLMRRNVGILLKFSLDAGHPHPNLGPGLNNYQFLLNKLTLTPVQISQRFAELGKEAGYDEKSFQELLKQLAPGK